MLICASILIYYQRKLEKFDGIPTANEYESLMKLDDMDAEGKLFVIIVYISMK